MATAPLPAGLPSWVGHLSLGRPYRQGDTVQVPVRVVLSRGRLRLWVLLHPVRALRLVRG